MNILVFDTETTGFPDRYSDFISPTQPRLVSLAAVLYDEEGACQGSLYSLIRPEGWVIPEAATAIHGISQEQALRFGYPLGAVLTLFDYHLYQADLVMAFNFHFDRLIYEISCVQAGRHNYMPDSSRWRCAMHAAAPICNLRKVNGKPKWPKLGELYFHLYGQEMKKAHNNLVNTQATGIMSFELRRRGLWDFYKAQVIPEYH